MLTTYLPEVPKYFRDLYVINIYLSETDNNIKIQINNFNFKIGYIYFDNNRTLYF
jgi:hypothetical protein